LLQHAQRKQLRVSARCWLARRCASDTVQSGGALQHTVLLLHDALALLCTARWTLLSAISTVATTHAIIAAYLSCLHALLAAASSRAFGRKKLCSRQFVAFAATHLPNLRCSCKHVLIAGWFALGRCHKFAVRQSRFSACANVSSALSELTYASHSQL
jgi:hypothetical protein